VIDTVRLLRGVCRITRFMSIRWLAMSYMRRPHWSTTVPLLASSIHPMGRCWRQPTLTAKCCFISCPTTLYVVFCRFTWLLY